ncbi:MAG: hypothetical protein GXO47_09420 [Chlorobi bacterium]|nr:hypothetical protein [Chlorobiota bacterium]
MNCKCNKLYIGLIIGLILPIITAGIFYLSLFKDKLDIYEFLQKLIEVNGMGKLLSISVLSNMIVFFIAINKERLLAARGILTATLIYGLIVLGFKFLW